MEKQRNCKDRRLLENEDKAIDLNKTLSSIKYQLWTNHAIHKVDIVNLDRKVRGNCMSSMWDKSWIHTRKRIENKMMTRDIYHAKSNSQRSRLALSISNKIVFKSRSIAREN
jgi:hypothetical protein